MAFFFAVSGDLDSPVPWSPNMSRRTRIILILLGLLLAVSFVAFSYAYAPSNVLRDSTPLAPTLFTLPAGGVP